MAISESLQKGADSWTRFRYFDQICTRRDQDREGQLEFVVYSWVFFRCFFCLFFLFFFSFYLFSLSLSLSPSKARLRLRLPLLVLFFSSLLIPYHTIHAYMSGYKEPLNPRAKSQKHNKKKEKKKKKKKRSTGRNQSPSAQLSSSSRSPHAPRGELRVRQSS